MPDPDHLRAARDILKNTADELWSEAGRQRGKNDDLAWLLAEAARKIRYVSEGLAEDALTARGQTATTEDMMPAARAHISAGKAREGSPQVKRLLELANKKNHTLRSLSRLAEAETGHKVPASNALSRALNGQRPIRKSVADVIARVTGYAATKANWPGGWANEE